MDHIHTHRTYYHTHTHYHTRTRTHTPAHTRTRLHTPLPHTCLCTHTACARACMRRHRHRAAAGARWDGRARDALHHHYRYHRTATCCALHTRAHTLYTHARHSMPHFTFTCLPPTRIRPHTLPSLSSLLPALLVATVLCRLYACCLPGRLALSLPGLPTSHLLTTNLSCYLPPPAMLLDGGVERGACYHHCNLMFNTRRYAKQRVGERRPPVVTTYDELNRYFYACRLPY